MKILRTLIALIFLCAGSAGISSAIANTSLSHCVLATSGFGASQTSDCQLPYADNGQIINPVYVCHELSGISGIGDITDPGRDYLLSTNFVSLGRSGSVTAPQQINVNATISEECQKYPGAYLVSGKVIAPSGTSYPITFGAGDFVEGYQDLNPNHYCFLEFAPMCGYSHFQGSVPIPASAETGMYKVSMTLSAGPMSVPGIVPVTETFSNILEVAGTTANAPQPAPSPSGTSNTVTDLPHQTAIIPNFSVTSTASRLIVGISSSEVAKFLRSNPTSQLVSAIETPDGTNFTSQPTAFQTGTGQTFYYDAPSGQLDPGTWRARMAVVESGIQGQWSAWQSLEISVAPTPSPEATKAPTKANPAPSASKAPIPKISSSKAKAKLNKLYQYMPDLLSALNAAGIKCTGYLKNATNTLGTREEGDCHWNGQELTLDIYSGSAKTAKKLVSALVNSGLESGYALLLQNWSIHVNDGATAKLLAKLTGAVTQ